MRFSGRCVIVTGGGSGIGLETAKQFLREGARVIAIDISERDKGSPPNGLENWGDRYEFFQCDVSQEPSVSKMVDYVTSRYGGVDVLVNNAGILRETLLHECTESEFDDMMAVNVKGVFNCTKHVLPGMMERQAGVIVTTASVTAEVAWGGIPVYNATKAAAHLLTRSVAIDYAKYGIRANSVAPANVDTPMTDATIPEGEDIDAVKRAKGCAHPISRLCTPLDVAMAILYLASDDASFITGALLPVDGGYMAR